MKDVAVYMYGFSVYRIEFEVGINYVIETLSRQTGNGSN